MRGRHQSEHATLRCVVRDERLDDLARVAHVHTQAFGQPDEAAMVQAVREVGQATLSLVAELHDGQPQVVGHILLSPVTLDGADTPRGLGLAPMAVLPDHQGVGIGSMLVETALGRARELGVDYLVVLGHPGYYPRFDFLPASRFGLTCTYGVPDEVFMAQELRPGALDGASGVVRYLPAFG